MSSRAYPEMLSAGHDDVVLALTPFDRPVPPFPRAPLRHRAKDRLRLLFRAAALPPRFVTRTQWGAAPPTGVMSTNITPANGGVAYHWEGPKMGTWPHSECAGKVRQIQRFHQQVRGWVTIAYTGVVCPHGYLFEGRGVGKRTAANGTSDGNQRFYALCALMGEGDDMSAPMQAALRDGTAWLRRAGAGLLVKPHRWFKPTACPGPDVTALAAEYDGRAISAPAPPPVQKEAIDVTRMPVLARGSRGYGVRRLEGLLLAHGYGPSGLVDATGRPDGVFGAGVETALGDFQRAQRLRASKTTDEATWKRLLGLG